MVGQQKTKEEGLLVLQDPFNHKRYAIIDQSGNSHLGKADAVTDAIQDLIQKADKKNRAPPTNIEWAALRTLAGTRPVIVPTRKGGAWLYIERLDVHIYEIRILAPYSVERGRARLVTLSELAVVITKIRTKNRAPGRPPE